MCKKQVLKTEMGFPTPFKYKVGEGLLESITVGMTSVLSHHWRP